MTSTASMKNDKMRSSLQYLLGTIAIMLLASCGSNIYYNKNKSLPDDVWNQEHIVQFDVDIPDSTEVYDLYLTLRHSTSYGYSNLYLFVETLFPDGQTANDTIELLLADKSGKWYGKGFGKLKDNKILIRKGFRFPQSGMYSFFFEQAMREENLEGITDIGMSIEQD